MPASREPGADAGERPRASDEAPDDPEASPALPTAALARAAAPIAAGAPADHDSRAVIWKLAWPFMLGQVLVNLVSLIDIAMVGRLGPDAVAAVGYATQLFFLVQSVLFAVGFACIALMARAIGAGDAARARHALAASLQLAFGAALVASAAILARPHAVLRALGAPEPIVAAGVPYLQLVLASSLLLSLALTLENGMRANRDTRTPMRVAAVVTALKTALNALLIFGLLGFPRLELVGAGLATLLAQAVALVLLASVARRARAGSPLALRRDDLGHSRRLLPDLVRVALPGMGERLVMNLALLAYFRVLSEYGPVAIAAYTVGIRVLAFSWIPGTGFGAAAATLVGQALGAQRPDAAMRAGWRATQLALGVAITLGALCALARGPLARLFTDDASVVSELGPFLLCLAIAQPFLQAHFALGGAHRGAGDTWTPMVAATLGNWALRVPLAVLFAYTLELDVVWVWYALVFDHLTRAVWLALSFRRGRWHRRLAVRE